MGYFKCHVRANRSGALAGVGGSRADAGRRTGARPGGRRPRLDHLSRIEARGRALARVPQKQFRRRARRRRFRIARRRRGAKHRLRRRPCRSGRRPQQRPHGAHRDHLADRRQPQRDKTRIARHPHDPQRHARRTAGRRLDFALWLRLQPETLQRTDARPRQAASGARSCLPPPRRAAAAFTRRSCKRCATQPTAAATYRA